MARSVHLASDYSDWTKSQLVDRLEELRQQTDEHEAVRLELAQFAAIVESSADAVIAMTVNETITKWNEAAEDMFGFTAEEAIGEPISIIIPEHQLEVIRHKIGAAGQGKPIESFEAVHRRKDGVLIDVSVTISPIKDAAGNVVGLSAIKRDITERKRAEEAVRTSAARFRALFKNSPVPIFLWRKSGDDFVRLDHNQAAEELSKGTASKTTGIKASEMFAAWPEGLRCMERCHAEHTTLKRLARRSIPRTDDVRWIDSTFVFVPPDMVMVHAQDVNERIEAEAALNASEKRLAAFFENAPVGMALLDLEYRYLALNETLARMNGKTMDEHLGRHPRDILPDALQLQLAEKQTASVLAGTPSVDNDLSGETPGQPGVVRHWNSSRFPISGPDDTISSVGVIVSEITERMQAEVALRESEQRFRDIAEMASDWIWETGPDLRITWISARVEELYGRPAQDYLGKRIDELNPPDDDYEGWRRNVEDVRAHRPFRNYSFRRTDPEGRLHYLVSNGKPQFGADGEFKGYRGTGSEITAQVEAQEQVSRVQARFLSAIDSSAEGIALFDADERLVVCNRNFVANSILPEDRWVPGARYEDLLREIAKRDVLSDWSEQREDDWVANRLERFRNHRDPFELHLPNGRWRRFQFERLHDGGTVVRYLDITELRQREEELRQSQKMEAVGQLTGGVAHEFNNLLMVIFGNLQMLDEQLAKDDPLRKFAAAATSGAMRGAELTQSLLAFSRKQELSAKPVDLNELVLDMRNILRSALGETIVIETRLAETLWRTSADVGQIEGALLNLALNSRDAMLEGGSITLRTSNVTLDADRLAHHADVVPGDFVMLEVADTGTGMTAEQSEHAFEPFYTTKGVGEGTGLGLSVVYGFGKQSGGFVEIDSEVGCGTSVRLCLPRAEQQDGEAELEKREHAEPVDGDGTILVVEDDPDVRALAVSLLSELGYDIVEAEDGHAALARLDERPDIELLFTDVVLPGGMNGHDIAREGRLRRPGLKVLFTSGYPDAGDGDQPVDDAISEFVRKPYRKSELAKKLAAVLHM